MYTRLGTASIKEETTANTYVIPDTFIELNSEDISVDFAFKELTPIINNRSKFIGYVDQKIPAPVGKININIEPNTFGHFIKSAFGSITSGRYLAYSISSGTFQVAEVVTGGSSSATGTVAYVGKNFLLLTSPTGDFTSGETITGGTSSATGTLTDDYDSSVYGHASSLPAEITNSYTLQINYENSAIRYGGVRFHGIDAIAQDDNVLTAGVMVMAQSIFRHTRVTDAVTAGAGSKAITVDQTKGLVNTDTIKVYRPGTGFLDFSAASVKTHTATVTDATTITVTNLETSLADGDIIVLAPQTASYSTANKMPFIGGSEMYTGADLDNLTSINMEEFSFTFNNEFEERHAAKGPLFADRFPTELVQKGLEAGGSLMVRYTNDGDFMAKYRKNTPVAIRFIAEADEIASTDINNKLQISYPAVLYTPYNTNLDVDSLINEDITYRAKYDSTTAKMMEILLVNNVTSY